MAPLRLMRAAAPRMAERGGGRIVNVCSSAGKRPSLTNAAYSVTKAAQLSLSRVFADAHAADGVLVNAVAPGAVSRPCGSPRAGWPTRWPAAKGISREEALEAQAAKIPIGRFGTPEEVANIVVVLCSEARLERHRSGLVGGRRRRAHSHLENLKGGHAPPLQPPERPASPANRLWLALGEQAFAP